MLLYIKNKAFPEQTFVEIFTPTDSVARVRAIILHRLYEIGHSHHQFRLKYKDKYLRDGYTLEEYRILNNAVINMIPLDDLKQWNINMMLHQPPEKDNSEVEDCVQQKLKIEVDYLNRRELYMSLYKVMLMMQSFFVLLGLFTNYWYFSFVYLFVLYVSLHFCPSFSRTGGWIGKSSYRRFEYIRAMAGLFLLGMIASLTVFGLSISKLNSSSYPTVACLDSTASCFLDAQTDVQIANCATKQQRCYQTSVFTSIYFGFVSFLMGLSCAITLYLFRNFQFTAGDYIEKYLTKSRDLKTLLEMVKNGSLFEKRSATFEIATMAASADDNKLEIVHENGLQVLISVALSEDATTQEYATEAIAECLTIPAIQDHFVTIGGVKSLTALLHVKNRRTFHQAITALYYITTDSDHNKMYIVDYEGLDDLLYACKYCDGEDREMLASILLELTYFEKTRSVLASMNTPIESACQLLYKCLEESGYNSTIAHILQAIELLAIESPTVILGQENLPYQLLEISSTVQDSRIWLLATKLLVCFVQNTEGREKLIMSANLVDSLYNYVQNNDVLLLRTLATICLQVTTPFKHREKLMNDGMHDFVSLLQTTCNDREVWNSAERAIENLQSGKPSAEDETPKKFLVHSASSSSISSVDSNTIIISRRPAPTSRDGAASSSGYR